MKENTTIRCTYSQKRNGTLHCSPLLHYTPPVSCSTLCLLLAIWYISILLHCPCADHMGCQTHISYLLTWVLWHYEPLVTPDALITPHTRHIPIGLWWPRPPNWWWPLSLPLVWLSLRNRRLGSGCAASGHLSLDNEASTTQMRSHLEWIDQDRRLSLIIAALTHRRVVTISQDLMSYPLEFPWFLEIKFLLLIDERNFNQSSIWHFRSSNFSVAKTTQIPVCQ